MDGYVCKMCDHEIIADILPKDYICPDCRSKIMYRIAEAVDVAEERWEFGEKNTIMYVYMWPGGTVEYNTYYKGYWPKKATLLYEYHKDKKEKFYMEEHEPVDEPEEPECWFEEPEENIGPYGGAFRDWDDFYTWKNGAGFYTR